MKSQVSRAGAQVCPSHTARMLHSGIRQESSVWGSAFGGARFSLAMAPCVCYSGGGGRCLKILPKTPEAHPPQRAATRGHTYLLFGHRPDVVLAIASCSHLPTDVHKHRWVATEAATPCVENRLISLEVIGWSRAAFPHSLSRPYCLWPALHRTRSRHRASLKDRPRPHPG